MLATLISRLLDGYLFSSPIAIVLFAFQVWMFIDAIRRQEYIWAIFLFFFFTFSAVLYFFLVYRQAPSATRGFELPGAGTRHRIKELQAQIHHLDKAHHHSQLGDIYFRKGKLDLAEASYRAALERDPEEIDARAHLGQTLLRKGNPYEARPFLETVCAQDPKHDYGHTMLAYGECLASLGETNAAIPVYERVLQSHTYARARVQLAEAYIAANRIEDAREQLREAINEDVYAPAFDRKRNNFWIKRAKQLAKKLG